MKNIIHCNGKDDTEMLEKWLNGSDEAFYTPDGNRFMGMFGWCEITRPIEIKTGRRDRVLFSMRIIFKPKDPGQTEPIIYIGGCKYPVLFDCIVDTPSAKGKFYSSPLNI